MKLRHIQFVLENCDTITVDGKYIGEFIVDDIKTSIHRVACNAIGKFDIANTVTMEIHKDANKEHYPLGCQELDPEYIFDRLGVGDITCICFDLDDSNECGTEHFEYFVDWAGDSDCINEAQTTYVSDCGNMYLVIAKDKKVEDYFNKDEINDVEHMDFHFDMCDVGDKYGDPHRYDVSE